MSTLSARVHPSDIHRSRADQTFIDEVTSSASGVAGAVRDRTLHSYYGHDDPNGVVTCLYALETLRQAETWFAHARLRRPDGTKFVWRSVSMSIRRADTGRGDADVKDGTFVLEHVDAKASRHQYRGAVRLGDVLVLMDELTVTYVGLEAYEILRTSDVLTSETCELFGGRRPEPERVGRVAASDVAIGWASDGSLQVAAPFDSPVFFEHVQDHWPGMVLVDAAVQACQYNLDSGQRLSRLTCEFLRYGELDSPITVCPSAQAVGSARAAFDVDLVQEGRTSATLSAVFD